MKSIEEILEEVEMLEQLKEEEDFGGIINFDIEYIGSRNESLNHPPKVVNVFN